MNARDNEPTIAVIVPVLNEAETIGALIDDLKAQAFFEIIVVDGGSTDGTNAIVASKNVCLIATRRGRGLQLNAGAYAAHAQLLLFLHADTRLPAEAARHIRATLSDARVSAGCFRLSFDARHPLLRLYAWASGVDSLFTTFGDQAYFVRADDFRAVGGFPDWPFLEDVAFRRRMKRRGSLVKTRARVVTSARRFHADGVLRRQLLNTAILLAYLAGVSPERLARWYRPQRAQPKV